MVISEADDNQKLTCLLSAAHTNAADLISSRAHNSLGLRLPLGLGFWWTNFTWRDNN